MILGLILGVFSVAAGVVTILDRHEADDGPSAWFWGLAWIALGITLMYFAAIGDSP